MTKAKEACLYKSAITKKQFVNLLYVLGGTALDNRWKVPLVRPLQTLCDRGLVETINRKATIILDFVIWGDNVQFGLTKRGEKYLSLYTLSDMLVKVRELRSDGLCFSALPLCGVISLLSLEFLPEFLIHEDALVREFAEKRQKDLTDERAGV